jgi:uncharacterized protein (TIGR02453 family)
MASGFTGWPERALTFYEGLEADNSKAYWQDHKEVYERDVKGPMDALLAELTGEFGEVHLFRPYRDTRFSRDKSPYKTAIAATVGRCYISLSADGLHAGAGMYHMAPDQLVRYRDAVVAERTGKKLESVVGALRASGLDVHGSDPLKTAPRGYPKDHARAELLRYKGVVVMKGWLPASWFGTTGVRKRVVEVWRAADPLLSWLDARVGPTVEAD